jgi:ADP-ribosyl-[dinitrogen reductase] hydrolase
MSQRDYYKDVLFGVAVGDALGVPVEFENREDIARNPVTDMRGYGTYNLKPGTWSDDSSLTFCLAEALTVKYDLNKVADNFINWLYKNYWTATGSVFDVGMATKAAIDRLVKGIRPDLAGGMDSYSNGNGSLMRILPLVFYIKDKPIEDRYQIVKDVSSITHAHIRSVISCFYYVEFAIKLLEGEDKFSIYQTLKTEITEFLEVKSINPIEVSLFEGLLKNDIAELDEDDVRGSGYVVHTLQASIWCLLKTDSYPAAVLKAVNLGEDTDTTGAVTGGLAGLLYGFDLIPESWVEQLAKKDEIADLAQRLKMKLTLT